MPLAARAAYDDSAGALSFTGAGSPSTYDAILRSLTYQDNNPTPIGGARTIRVVVSDGINNASATMTVNVGGTGGGIGTGGGPVPTSTTITAPPITAGSNATVTVTVTALGGFGSNSIGSFASRSIRSFASRSIRSFATTRGGSVPTGSITLSVDGGMPFPIGTLNSQGTVTYGALRPSQGPGPYNLTATYIPTGNFQSSSGSTVLMVNRSSGGGAVATTTSVYAPPITAGSFATVTVSVTALGGFSNNRIGSFASPSISSFASTSTGGVPTGYVTLSVDGGAPFSIGTLNSQGTVNYGGLQPSNGPGPYVLTATYVPTGNFQGSSGSAVLIVTSALPPLPNPPNPKYYYIDATNGRDNFPYDGSYQMPWQTIRRVNQAISNGDITPGATIPFHRGGTFPGNLVFPGVSGTSTAPITVTDYVTPCDPLVTSPPLITAGTGTGISVLNAGNIAISNLEITGAYKPTLTFNLADGNGIELINTTGTNGQPPASTFSNITISNVKIHNFGGPAAFNALGGLPYNTTHYGGSGRGILVYSDKSLDDCAGYECITISECDIHHTRRAAIETTGHTFDYNSGQTSLAPIVRHLRIEQAKAHEVFSVVNPHKDPNVMNPQDAESHDGNGIILFFVYDGVLQHCQAYNNGIETSLFSVASIGFSTYFCTRMLIQYNEAYGNRSLNGGDEGGFDFDRFTTNSIMQYNYSHDNDGWGYMLGSLGVRAPDLIPEKNVIRFNISVNDCRKKAWGSLLFETPRASDVEVYNNTFYMSKNDQGESPPVISCGGVIESLQPGQTFGPPTINFYNNILFSDTTDSAVITMLDNFKPANLNFQGNDYYNKSGEMITIIWNGQPIINTLKQFRMMVMGQEENGNGTSEKPGLFFETLPGAPAVGHITNIADELEPYFDVNAVNASTLQEVLKDGIDLATSNLGPMWWAPDQFYWEGLLPNRAIDFFKHPVPDMRSGTFSMGASQYDSGP